MVYKNYLCSDQEEGYLVVLEGPILWFNMQRLLLAAGLLSLPFHASAYVQQSSGITRRGVDLDSFRPLDKAKYMNSDEVQQNAAIMSLAGGNYVDVATRLVQKMMPRATFRVVDDHYVSTSGMGHVNFRQTIHGIDVDNADFHVNVRLCSR